MTAATWYAVVGALLAALGLHGAATRAHLLRKVLALNVAASGVFLVLVSLGARAPDGETDPVPQAMVLTGIVVAVSATALAVSLSRRIHEETGRPDLSGDAPSGDDE